MSVNIIIIIMMMIAYTVMCTKYEMVENGGMTPHYVMVCDTHAWKTCKNTIDQDKATHVYLQCCNK